MLRYHNCLPRYSPVYHPYKCLMYIGRKAALACYNTGWWPATLFVDIMVEFDKWCHLEQIPNNPVFLLVAPQTWFHQHQNHDGCQNPPPAVCSRWFCSLEGFVRLVLQFHPLKNKNFIRMIFSTMVSMIIIILMTMNMCAAGSLIAGWAVVQCQTQFSWIPDWAPHPKLP